MAKLTDSQIEEIVRWAEIKKSGTWIGRRMNIPAATVNYQMLINGYDPWIPTRRNKRDQAGGFSEQEDDRMLELSRTGKGVAEIARLMKRAQTSIRIRILTLEVRAEKALEGEA